MKWGGDMPGWNIEDIGRQRFWGETLRDAQQQGKNRTKEPREKKSKAETGEKEKGENSEREKERQGQRGKGTRVVRQEGDMIAVLGWRVTGGCRGTSLMRNSPPS